MNRAILRQLNSLTGRCEALQHKVSAQRHRSDQHRRVAEYVAEAKNKLMAAVRAAEQQS